MVAGLSINKPLVPISSQPSQENFEKPGKQNKKAKNSVKEKQTLVSGFATANCHLNDMEELSSIATTESIQTLAPTEPLTNV